MTLREQLPPRSWYTSADRHRRREDRPTWPRWRGEGSSCPGRGPDPDDAEDPGEGCTGHRHVYQDGSSPTGLDLDAAAGEPAGGWICDGPDRHEGWFTVEEVQTGPDDIPPARKGATSLFGG